MITIWDPFWKSFKELLFDKDRVKRKIENLIKERAKRSRTKKLFNNTITNARPSNQTKRRGDRHTTYEMTMISNRGDDRQIHKAEE